jgi:hypothetical protein
MEYQIPRVTPAVKYLLIAYGVMFVLSIFVPAFPQLFALYTQGSQQVDPTIVYRIFTYTFVNPLANTIGFLFFALFLWWVGSSLESQWGTRTFLFFLAFTIPISGILTLLIVNAIGLGIPVYGTLGITFAIIAIFAFSAPETPFYLFGMFPLKAKWLVLISVVFTFIVPSPEYIIYALVFQGVTAIVAIGFVMVKFPLPYWFASVLGRIKGGDPFRKKFGKNNIRIFKKPGSGDRAGRKPDRSPLDDSTKKKVRMDIEKLMDRIYKEANNKDKDGDSDK